MKTILSALAALCLAGSVQAKEVAGKTYKFEVDDAVTFTDMNSGMEMYSFDWGTEPGKIKNMIFMSNPAPMSEAMLQPMTDMMKVQLAEQFKAQGMEVSEITVKPAAFGVFKGNELRFSAKAEGQRIQQSLFVLMDADQKGWNATVTSGGDDISAEAVAMLKTAKKIAAE